MRDELHARRDKIRIDRTVKELWREDEIYGTFWSLHYLFAVIRAQVEEQKK